MRAVSEGPSFGDPIFPGRRLAASPSSPPKLPRLKESQQSTRACRKIHRDRVSEDLRWQKGGACGVPRERLDARVAAVSVTLYVCCMDA